MYLAPTSSQIRNLGRCFSVFLEEIPSLEPGTIAISHEFVSRMRNRPVLSRRLFKCRVHTLKKKTFVVMALRLHKDAVFSGSKEMETYMILAIQSLIQTAFNKGFEQLRLSSPIRMLEDVMIDNGFEKVRQSRMPGGDEFSYNGCKQLI